ncbi:hypothetical protein V490_07341 [Pseudogymnoascus sp. VKM F-3557]|nr:hypothetical protein V490_07341 [Pseudogymnoascus sp. VKM F-3557]
MIEIAIDAVEPDWRPSRAKKKRPQRFLRAVDPTGRKKHKHTTAPSGHDFLISRVHGLAGVAVQKRVASMWCSLNLGKLQIDRHGAQIHFPADHITQQAIWARVSTREREGTRYGTPASYGFYLPQFATRVHAQSEAPHPGPTTNDVIFSFLLDDFHVS